MMAGDDRSTGWEREDRPQVGDEPGDRQFRDLAEALPHIIWAARSNGFHDYFNQRWYDYTGMTPEQSLGWGWKERLHPDDRARAEAGWLHAVATGAPYDVENRFRSSGGSYRWFLCRGLPLRDAQGRIRSWLGTCTDIDDQKRAEEALKDNDRRKDEFLAMLAHELRNPLAAVRSAVHLFRSGAPVETQEWGAEVVERQVTHLSHLIDDLLDVSRITRGKIRLRVERLEASPLLETAVETVRPLAAARRQTLTVNADRGALWLDADATRLEQVLANLLSNAVKYTESGGSITFSAQREGDAIVFRVRDTGIGIPGELLPRIFELFSQGDRTLARSEGGLGIGLTLVKQLVDLHHGTVSATSEGPGLGSEFVVALPAAPALLPQQDEPPVSKPPDSPPPPKVARLARVLIVDDNADLARSMARLLKLLGHETRLAYDGPSAIAEAKSYRPDFIILDIGLPLMNGYEVAQKLRHEEGLTDTVIVAVTGYGQEEDRRRSREAGFNHHLVKPVDHDVLFSLLAESGERL